MIQAIGDRAAGLYFVNEKDEAYYFKDDLIVPAGDKNEQEDELTYDLSALHRRESMEHCARSSAKIAVGRHFSSRILATSRLADKLGIGDIVAQADKAKLIINGKEHCGTRMKPIGGTIYRNLDRLPELKGYRPYYTTKAVRQLTILAMFDMVCGQIDRHSKNIKLYCDLDLNSIRPLEKGEEGCIRITGVCAIDHDLSFGELRYADIKKCVSKGKCICPELFGEMQYPAVDVDFCDRLLSIDEAAFREDFCDLLTKAETDAFIDRLDGLRQAVLKERAREERNLKDDALAFPRFIKGEDKYVEYLRRMEENAVSDKPDAHIRFSSRPTYLKSEILVHKPLLGRDVHV